MAPRRTRSTVGDYAKLQRGNTYSGKLVGELGPALLGLGSIEPGGGFRRDKYKTFGGECPAKIMVRPGEIYVALKGATKDGSMVGSVARLPEDIPSGRLTQDTARLDFIDHDKDTADHVYWALRTPQYRGYCAGRLTGSASASFSRDDLLSYTVSPITSTSKALVDIFECIERKIQLDRETNSGLESMARAIFKSWFVDFGPVRAKAEGRQPAGMDAETAALFPTRFMKGDAGKLPNGWTASTIAAISDLNERTLTGASAPPRLEYVEISGVMRGDILETTWYDRSKAPSRARRGLRHGDTVLSTVRPDRGSYFLALRPHEQMVASTWFAVLTPRSVPWSFVYCAATQKEVFEYLGMQADGGAYPAVSPEIIGKWELCLPGNRLILDRFQSICAPLLEHAEANRKMSHTLAALRDLLLPKLLSGQLRIRDAEKMVEAHV